MLTEPGQRADQAAIRSSDRAVASVPEPLRESGRSLLELVSAGSLLAAVLVLGALGWLSRRPRLIGVPLLIVGASLVATELAKHVVLVRPDLIADGLIPDNSYPSGHATVAISLGLAAILVAPARLRAPVAFGAAALAGGMGVLVLAGAWHRPSDPLGSFALTVAAAAAATALLLPRVPELGRDDRPASGGGRSTGRLEIGAAAAGALVFFGAIALATARFGSEVDWTAADAAFLAACATIIAAAGLAAGRFTAALQTRSKSRDR